MPDQLSKSGIVRVQRALNAFTTKHLKGITPVIADGDKGPSTDKRIRECKYWLGFNTPTSAAVHSKLIERLEHPKDPKRFPDPDYVTRGRKRRRKQRARWRKENLWALIAPGVTKYDGVPVALWLVPYLQYARTHKAPDGKTWQGKLVSGWRSPAYSESLCLTMCGAPSCPGRCAGKSSNHSGSDKPKGAVDVSDYVRFGQLMRQCPRTPQIFNALGTADPVHFSSTGR